MRRHMKSNWLISFGYGWFSKIQSYSIHLQRVLLESSISNNIVDEDYCRKVEIFYEERVVDHVNKTVFFENLTERLVDQNKLQPLPNDTHPNND